jgi:hypothetical protein
MAEPLADPVGNRTGFMGQGTDDQKGRRPGGRRPFNGVDLRDRVRRRQDGTEKFSGKLLYFYRIILWYSYLNMIDNYINIILTNFSQRVYT